MPVTACYTPDGGGNSCLPLFTIFLCRFEIFKIFVQVAMEPHVDSALGPVAPTGNFFSGPNSHLEEFLNLFDINPDHFQDITLH